MVERARRLYTGSGSTRPQSFKSSPRAAEELQFHIPTLSVFRFLRADWVQQFLPMCISICFFLCKLWMVKYIQTFDHMSIMPLWTNHLGMLTGHNFGQMQEFSMWCHIITHYFSTNTTNPPELLWSSNWEIGNLCQEMIMATPGFCRLIERSRPPPSLSSPPLFGRFLAVVFTIFSGNCFTALYSLNLETLQM